MTCRLTFGLSYSVWDLACWEAAKSSFAMWALSIRLITVITGCMFTWLIIWKSGNVSVRGKMVAILLSLNPPHKAAKQSEENNTWCHVSTVPAGVQRRGLSTCECVTGPFFHYFQVKVCKTDHEQYWSQYHASPRNQTRYRQHIWEGRQ